MWKKLTGLKQDQSGITAIEYGLLIFFLAITIISGTSYVKAGYDASGIQQKLETAYADNPDSPNTQQITVIMR